MSKGNMGRALKQLRGKQTQQQFALDLEVTTREGVSSYEQERAKVPPDIAKRMMNLKDDPWFVMALRHEYTGTGPVKLEGARVALQRSSSKEKLLEELDEAVEALKGVSMANEINDLMPFKKQELEYAMGQLIDVITGIEHLAAIVCEEGGISYKGVWEEHYRKLISRGYVNKEQLREGRHEY
jgi:NTP pyrophosphatase (non-canonical NTP hydrolase)